MGKQIRCAPAVGIGVRSELPAPTNASLWHEHPRICGQHGHHPETIPPLPNHSLARQSREHPHECVEDDPDTDSSGREPTARQSRHNRKQKFI